MLGLKLRELLDEVSEKYVRNDASTCAHPRTFLLRLSLLSASLHRTAIELFGGRLRIVDCRECDTAFFAPALQERSYCRVPDMQPPIIMSPGPLKLFLGQCTMALAAC